MSNRIGELPLVFLATAVLLWGVACAGPLAQPTPTPTAVPSRAPTATVPWPALLMAGGTFIREGPSFRYPVVLGDNLLLGVEEGTLQRVLGYAEAGDGIWYLIQITDWERKGWVLGSQCQIVQGDIPHIDDIPPIPTPRPTNTPVPRYCCQICSTGKACGDSCISRSKVCHEPPGCACDN